MRSALCCLIKAKDLNELKAMRGITICDSIPQSEFRNPHLEGPGAIEGGGGMRFLEGEINRRIQPSFSGRKLF